MGPTVEQAETKPDWVYASVEIISVLSTSDFTSLSKTGSFRK
jgi:hypothetical protein